MSVQQWGHGSTTALMLHCTLANGGAWAGVARHLRDHLSMTAPDLVAHGQGPEYDPARDFHDQATEAARSHLPQHSTHLIGHSFGATIALRLALENPDRIASLTLIEPVLFCATNGPGRRAHDAAVADVPKALADHDTAHAARLFLDLWGAESFDTLSPAHQHYITDRMWIPAASEPALIQDRADLLAQLADLHAPSLLLEGTLSPPVIGEITTRLATDISHARREMIRGAAHMAPVTHPRATAAAILDFLNAL